MTELFETLSHFQAIGQDIAWRFWLVFLRVAAAMALLPAFGEQAIPQRVKLVVALAFTIVVAPAAGAIPSYASAPLAAMGVETVIGLTFGLALRMMVLALQTAGSIAANATSLSQLFGGAGPEPQPALSNLLVMAGLALALASGLHIHLAQALIQSYWAFPAGTLPSAADWAKWGVAQVSSAFALAFVLAAPFTIAAFLYNVALGVINRALPALMVSFIGAPALAGGGLLMIALVSPILLAIWLHHFQVVISAPFAVQP
ncbi:MAG: flagellar biosynthetic protein FliR [Cypionkella sp.]|nr:flagellar biosynthetic protein FliR [Cypionkella sp.]